MTFNHYSEYYDLLYQDKDYYQEVRYLLKLLTEFRPECQTILELGCGTGLHGSLLSQEGMNVTGVEVSEKMLEAAKLRSYATGAISNSSFSAIHGDARSVRIPHKFDAVISVFHVASYQISNEDIQAMFETASIHLKQNGIFIFDAWYGPAVLTERPTTRIKRMENERASVIRLAEPLLDVNQNVVNVHYTLLITDKRTGITSPSIHELHRMRYFFLPEIQLYATLSGLQLLHSEQWLTRVIPSSNSWGVTFVCQKK